MRGARVRDDNDDGVGYRYAHMAAAATLVVKSGPGVLHTLTLNTPTEATVITVYDNTAGSGTVIAVVTVAAGMSPGTLFLDAAFTIGCTVVMASANSDITLTYI